MIHNTFLVRISTREIIASTQYWPVEVEEEALKEFVSTRENLKSEHDVSELPLVIGDHKFLGRDWNDDSVLVFVTDKGEDEGNVYEKIDQALKAFKKTFKNNGIEGVAAKYETLIEPSVTTRLKIALVGEGGVGKTTTLHLLLGDTPPLQYVPTIALNLETVENIRFGNYSLVLWDFAGQERFRTLWRFYFHGADVIFLVCDSTLRNVIISKDILKLIKRDAPKVPVFAMANKQDKPNAMKPEVVQKILGIPTYPMVAIDKDRRDEMLRILMTAASQYVGVALPDLPAAELLKFTDAATEEAIAAEVEADVEEEEEYETVIEEVYVDEDGRILEDIEDYEIIEEEVEEIEEKAEAVTEIDEGEVGVDDEEDKIEPTEEEEVVEEIVVEAEPEPEMPVEVEIEEDEVEVEPDEVEDFEVPTVAEDEEEVVEVEIEPEAEPPTPDMRMRIRVQKGEGPELVIEENAEALQMAKDLIFEALEADDIIVAEIDQVSAEEIDTALEAIGSDEAMPIDDEKDDADQIDEESLMELETILGPLDRSVGGLGTGETEDDDDDEHLPINGDTLAELDRLLDVKDAEVKDE
ncbi:MAG: ADP-ribosylation factor-like protein [Candidatus Thorarchaeota archaeon]